MQPEANWCESAVTSEEPRYGPSTQDLEEPPLTERSSEIDSQIHSDEFGGCHAAGGRDRRTATARADDGTGRSRLDWSVHPHWVAAL